MSHIAAGSNKIKRRGRRTKMKNKTEKNQMNHSRVVSRAEWLPDRLELLKEEKELTRRSDELARRRQELPWGSDRQGVSIRDRRGERLARRPLPRTFAAARLPLHVWARLHGGVSVLLGDSGRLQRGRDSLGQSRRDALGGFARAAREAAGVQTRSEE